MKTSRQKATKIKIGTILDEEILQRLKERSAHEGRTICALIEEAILRHEQQETFSKELRVRALESVFAIKFSISDEDLNDIMEMDVYDQ